MCSGLGARKSSAAVSTLRRMTGGVVAGMAVRDLALHGPLSLWEFDSTTNF